MLSLKEFFYLLSDETRLRCLVLLQIKKECCVCDFVCALQNPQPKISRHLAILRGLDVVSHRREGAWIYYSLDPTLPAWASRLLSAIAQETAEVYSSDLLRLNERSHSATCCEEAPSLKKEGWQRPLQVGKKLLRKALN